MCRRRPVSIYRGVRFGAENLIVVICYDKIFFYLVWWHLYIVLLGMKLIFAYGVCKFVIKVVCSVCFFEIIHLFLPGLDAGTFWSDPDTNIAFYGICKQGQDAISIQNNNNNNSNPKQCDRIISPSPTTMISLWSNQKFKINFSKWCDYTLLTIICNFVCLFLSSFISMIKT